MQTLLNHDKPRLYRPRPVRPRLPHPCPVRRAMNWRLSHRADPNGVALADRHYNRQTIGAPQFVPPGRCLVLITDGALWVTSWPYAEYVKHDWPGAWINSLFRNESGVLSSQLIIEAVAATRYHWPVPERGLITFVDSNAVRKKRDPGRCYRRAGFEHVGFTKGGLYAFQMKEDKMPAPSMAIGSTINLFGAP